MFYIKISDIVIAIDNRYPYVQHLCRDHIVPECAADLMIAVTDEEIEWEQRNDFSFSPDYCESLAIYRKICQRLLAYDAFLMHAAVIAMDGKAYAFAASSGTGKTTHIRQWKALFGKRVEVINGDKPIIRKMNGCFYACGTPWCGKEHMGGSSFYPLQAICFIEQGSENQIRPLQQGKVIGRLFRQLLLPEDQSALDRYMGLVEQLLTAANFFLLTCKPEPEAAQRAYEGMVEGRC